MLKNVEAVIFDLDGTLVDSMWLWEAIDIEYLKRFNLELPSDLQEHIEGNSFTETALYFKERFKIQDSIDKIKEDWNGMALDYYSHKVPLKRGVQAFLDHLKEHNIPMGIGTSNSRQLVEIIIDKHNIGHYFKSIRTSCEVNKGKPAPDIFLKVAEDLGVAPEKCLVFEDIPNGILAAKNAGMKVCAIYDDFSKMMNEEKIQLADYFIEHYEVLLGGEEVEEYEA
jgi:HAD superfamily hydrolase (TIGR01509 family)